MSRVFCDDLIDFFSDGKMYPKGWNLGCFPYNGSIPAGLAYAAYKGPLKNRYNSIAVFLLGSMNWAVSLGEKNPIQPDQKKPIFIDSYLRAVAARRTWAKHVKHFFMVTGLILNIYLAIIQTFNTRYN